MIKQPMWVFLATDSVVTPSEYCVWCIGYVCIPNRCVMPKTLQLSN